MDESAENGGTYLNILCKAQGITQASCPGIEYFAFNLVSCFRLAWSWMPALISSSSRGGIRLKARGVYGTSSGPDDSRSVSLLISTMPSLAGWDLASLGLVSPGPSQSNMEESKSFKARDI